MEDEKVIQNAQEQLEAAKRLAKELQKQEPTQKKPSHKKHVWELIKIYFVLIMGALVRAFAVEVMLLPHRITIGGIVGISEIIYYLTDGSWPIGFSIILLNLPILVVAYLMIGKKFAFRTTISVLVIGVSTYLFEIFHVSEALHILDMRDNLVLFSIVGGVMAGFTLAMSFYSGASTGGSDTISLLIQKKHNFSGVARFMVLVDAFIVAIAAIILHNFDAFLYSFVTIFVIRVAVEMIQRGFASAVVYEIITDKPEEVIAALGENLHRGITSIQVVGMYQKTVRTMLVCVVRKRQVNATKKLIKAVDPAAFAYSLGVMEVVGKGFRNIEV